MSNSGAKAALKGYRLQTLYILDEILAAGNKATIFQPEGNEDLAVYENDKLTRVVQVKAKSEPLTISSFSPAKKDSFFQRVVKLLEQNPHLIVDVISFGEIGSEIKNAWDGDQPSKIKVQSKLQQHGLTPTQIELLFTHICWRQLKESVLYQRFNNQLSKTITAGAPDNALSLLTAWLYVASEQQTTISQQDLITKITAIGKYLAEREAHHEHWFKSITPLTENKPENSTQLAREYYQGVAARYSHIQAELDVHRTKQLTTINEYFSQNKTVIIHGASGQGKTSLAYRYLYDYVPADWRLQINFVEDRHHAQSITLAIADHLAIFNATLYLYIDVAPRDLDWTALIKSLLDKPNIKILITIREEDLARQNVGDDELGFPATLALKFNEFEAKYVYQNLVEKGITSRYPSAKQAWLGFGGEGALLEYVYFLTQSASLKTRIRAQVKRIRAEVRASKLETNAIKLLLSCAIATAYETRIRLDLLIDEIDLKDPNGTFELFENEYLIRRSKNQLHVEALHPIRSKILIDILTDPVFSPWPKAALVVIPCIEEADLETFLLYSFAEHPQDFQLLFERLRILKIKKWVGAVGICRALLWYGIHCHVNENKKTIAAAIEFAGNSGWGVLKGDITGWLSTAEQEKVVDIFGQGNYKGMATAHTIQRQFTSNEQVFLYIKQWLVNFDGDIARPKNEQDYSCYGEILFWLGWNNITTRMDVKWLAELDVDNNFSNIEAIAELSLGLYYFDPIMHEQFISKNKAAITSLFQHATKTLWVESLPNNPIIHYAVPIKANSTNNELFELAVNHTRLLHRCMPIINKFTAKGYGHTTDKFTISNGVSVTIAIDKSELVPKQLIKINSTWSNYAQYENRPNDWVEYTDAVLIVRKKVVDGFSSLNKKLINYFRKTKANPLILGDKERDYWTSLGRLNMHLARLPKLAVDRWGYTSECTLNKEGKKDNDQQTINFLSTQNYYNCFSLALEAYITSVALFFHNAQDFLVLHGMMGRSSPEQIQQQLQWADNSGRPYSKASLNKTITHILDAHNQLDDSQQKFREHFGNLVDQTSLKSLEKMEKSRLAKALPLWYQFAYHPEKYWKDSPDARTAAIIKNSICKLIADIDKRLSTTQTCGFTATILSQNHHYAGKKALWITVELVTFTAYETCLKTIIEMLCKVIVPIKTQKLKYVALMTLWENVILVPLVNKATISKLSWVISIADFFSEKSILNEDKLQSHYLNPLEQQAIEYFNFKENCKAWNPVLDDLENELKAIFSIANYTCCFIEVAPKANTIGVEILQEGLSSLMPKLATNIERSIELINQLKTSDYDNKKNNALSLLLDIIEIALEPYSETNGNHVDIHLNSFKKCTQMLEIALDKLSSYKLQSFFFVVS